MIKPLLNQLGDWADNRTGYREMVNEALFENVPGGSKWRYVFGSMLVFAFVTQAVTGVFLWMSYSPGSQNAWSSVNYIQNEMQGGFLLRGVHHYMAQAMVVLLPIHLLQVILARAYQAPREINYWLGLVLMLITFALGLTGYLLPWDQKGYWATKVATELMALPPLVGEQTQKLVVGGSEYGHLTLTRFFTLHTGVLPALLIGFLALHLFMFRKHGLTPHGRKNVDEYFYPHQLFKDAVACAVLMVIVLTVTLARGAELGPPAEPTEPYDAARPEWYFLFLFQFLKKFEHSEFVGAIVIPGLIMFFLFLMPLIAKIRFGHIVNVTALLILIIGAGYLTYDAIDEDNYAAWHENDIPEDENERRNHFEYYRKSLDFAEAQAKNHHEYLRTKELVDFYGTPPEGPLALTAKDSEIQGPRLFDRSCASCHSYKSEHGYRNRGPDKPDTENPDPYGGPNLKGFATRKWIRDFLDVDKLKGDDYFGNTAHKDGTMVSSLDEGGDLSELTDDEKDQIAAFLSARAGLPEQKEADKEAAEDGTLEAGGQLFESHCGSCHDAGNEGGPVLDEYGTAKWLKQMIQQPNHESMYAYDGDDHNDRMPAFQKLMSEEQVDMVVRWLRGDDRELVKPAEEGEASNSDASKSEDKSGDDQKPAEAGKKEEEVAEDKDKDDDDQ